MRPRYLPYIIIGVILIYVSLYGVSGFSGLIHFQFTSDLSDDFNDNSLDTSKWQKFTYSQSYARVLETNQRLEFTKTSHTEGWACGVRTVHAGVFTQISVKVGIQGTGVVTLQISPDPDYTEAEGGPVDAYRIQWDGYGVRCIKWVDGTLVDLYRQGMSQVEAFKIEYDGSLIKFSFMSSGAWINAASATHHFSSPNVYVYMAGHAKAGSGHGTEWVDDFLLAAGTAPPPPPPENVGTIKLYAWDGSNWITGASLTMQYPDGPRTGQTPYTDTNAPTGHYSVSCSYGGSEKSHAFDLTAGQTVDYTFDFGGEEPPPPPPPNGDEEEEDFLKQILEMIDNFLQNNAIKSMLLLAGVACAGIGALMFIMPAPRPRFPGY